MPRRTLYDKAYWLCNSVNMRALYPVPKTRTQKTTNLRSLLLFLVVIAHSTMDHVNPITSANILQWASALLVTELARRTISARVSCVISTCHVLNLFNMALCSDAQLAVTTRRVNQMAASEEAAKAPPLYLDPTNDFWRNSSRARELEIILFWTLTGFRFVSISSIVNIHEIEIKFSALPWPSVFLAVECSLIKCNSSNFPNVSHVPCTCHVAQLNYFCAVHPKFAKIADYLSIFKEGYPELRKFLAKFGGKCHSPRRLLALVFKFILENRDQYAEYIFGEYQHWQAAICLQFLWSPNSHEFKKYATDWQKKDCVGFLPIWQAAIDIINLNLAILGKLAPGHRLPISDATRVLTDCRRMLNCHLIHDIEEDEDACPFNPSIVDLVSLD